MQKVLWIEDEEDQFNIFSFYLKKEFEIERVSNFEETMEKIRSNKVDLIVIDIIIPSGKKIIKEEELKNVKDTFYGFELIKEIRNIPKYSSVNIIVVTVVNDDLISNKIKKIDSKIEILCKYDTSPKEVAEVIKSYLQ